jgi:raffinose/stachyose/melibiose transport system substrate-binding protein
MEGDAIMRRRFPRTALLVGLAASLVAASCGGDDDDPDAQATAGDESGSTEPVTIEWWHIQNNDPGLSLWEDVAAEFEDAHPHVTIDITVYENEAFKTAVAPRLQAGDPPDLFQSWGGGGLMEEVDAGLVKDVTADVEPWIDGLNTAAVNMYQVDGKQYGVPFDLGMAGFWYNQDLFEEAGIDEPPTTWDELLDDVQQLKDADITPIALGEGDKWPGMFWWAYLALRSGGPEPMLQAGEDGSFDSDAFVEAGERLEELIAMDPFQDGFQAAVWDGAGGQAATIGTGQAAMHLMGQWAPGTQNANSPDGEGIGEALGWFPFPEVEGGEGDPTDAFGGGNGFAVGKDAPPEAVEFLEYVTSMDVARRWGETNSGILPVTIGSEDSTTDPYLQDVLAARAEAQYVQLYLDQAYSPELGADINDAVELLFAQQASPEDVAQMIADAASG